MSQTSIKFFWNGMKLNGSKKLIKGYWSYGKQLLIKGGVVNCAHIAFYKDSYEHLDKEIKDLFNVQNGSDSMSDYFETDHFKITKTNKFWNEILSAAIKAKEHMLNRYEKSCLKYSEKFGEDHERTLYHIKEKGYVEEEIKEMKAQKHNLRLAKECV